MDDDVERQLGSVEGQFRQDDPRLARRLSRGPASWARWPLLVFTAAALVVLCAALSLLLRIRLDSAVGLVAALALGALSIAFWWNTVRQ
jgi:hypothetical protein